MCATRTGTGKKSTAVLQRDLVLRRLTIYDPFRHVGKSQTTRFIADYLKKQGKKIAVVRHPMPYDQVLLNQRCQRYDTPADLVKYNCTIEEREVSRRHEGQRDNASCSMNVLNNVVQPD